MIRSSISLVLVALGAAALIGACNGHATDSSDASGGASNGGGKSGGAGGTDAGGGKSSGGNSNGGGPSSGGSHALGGGGAGGELEGPQPIENANPRTLGVGNCSDTTLGAFIALAQEVKPELADIHAIAPPDSAGELEAEVIPLTSSNGFSLAFKRGSGDCPSGCIDETFWYFDSDAECKPVYVGSYSTIYNSDGNCYDVEGAPSFDIGREVPPSSRCDFDPTPIDAAGAYSVAAAGTKELCPDAKGAPWEGPLEFFVKQNENNASKGTVEFKDVSPRLDGQAWPATITGSEVSVSFTVASSSCPDTVEINFAYDLTKKVGRLELFEVLAESCADPSGGYCKGSVSLTLGE